MAGVIGFSAERGDQLIVETLPFEATLNPEPLPRAANPAPPAKPWPEEAMRNKFVRIGAGVAVAVLIALLVMVFRLLPRKPPQPAKMAGQLAEAPAQDLNKQIEDQMAEQNAVRLKQETDALNALETSTCDEEGGGFDQTYQRTS